MASWRGCGGRGMKSLSRFRLVYAKHMGFFRNAIWQYGLQLVKYLLPLVTLPYLTRVLEPQGYAVYAYVLSYMSFAQVIIDFGFNLSGTKEIATARDIRECNRIIGSITQARLLLCVLTGIGCVIIGLFIPIIRENFAYMLLSFVAVCGRALAPDFLFQGKEQMGPITTRYLASKGVSTLLTFVVVHSVADLLWIPVLDIAASIIALVWSFNAGRRLFHTGIEWVDAKTCFKELAISGYYCFSNVASTSFNGLATLIIGAVLVDKAQISYWSLAMTVVAAVQALYMPVVNSLYPHMVNTRDWHFAKKLAIISMPAVVLLSIFICIFSGPIIQILGGDAYNEGTIVIVFVAPVLLFSYYSLLLGWPILGALGRVKELTMTTVISGVINIALLGILAGARVESVLAFAVIRSLAELTLCGLRFIECMKARNGLEDKVKK
ncbi:oligosaccharide flippase family protein [Bifidobacterium sp. LC6]|uniref:Oligosaccharide flippase family protein n=1 Tax=Bifidobacterium colobi TaxID=2809026 RepID=A0ABS5UYK0_9BIFI|nr:oligosaccharide flippase family protein [Bifidobacterium colobi]MBT1175736.1 oligosaccharide flippase family protein [Bifidobacterium colobi]